ncbi:MAG: prolyl oligopeptidase family serine peptidase [Planctomycetota bacterium]
MPRCTLTSTTAAWLAASLVLYTADQGNAEEFMAPETRRVDQVDTYHGTEVADPYRWLEADVRESEEVAAWTEAQNNAARAYLDALPHLGPIRQRLEKLWNFERYSAPVVRAGRYFFQKNDGLQDQPVLYVSDAPGGEGAAVIDPNTWSEDGTVSMGGFVVSDDARYLAYTRREAGSDWTTIRVLDVASGKEIEDVLRWTRWGNIVWNAAGDGFYYSRYPEADPDEKHQTVVANQMVYFHQLGDDQSQDQLVYKRPDNPTWYFWLERTDDNQYLVMSIGRSTDPQNQVLVRRVDEPDAEFRTLIGDFDNEFGLIGSRGERLFFLTDLDASSKRIVAMDVNQPGRDALEEVVPKQEATLRSATLFGDRFVASYLQDVLSRVRLFSIDGKPLGDVELPGLGSANGFGGKEDATETFFSFTSYTTPTSIYRYDLETGGVEAVRTPQIDFDPSRFESRQAFFTSKDGTRVPILVTHKKGLEPNGELPTLLYGYGGFNISLTPGFSVGYATWMEMGGVLAVPNLRGGGEYGEDWHQAGKDLNKQNVFDDFIAAAEWLIAEGYTKPERLAILGGSNGGLLVGACMTQRPDLFGACIPAVGVMDMLRYDQFTAGVFWRDEYGTADDEPQFRNLLGYSPYHNVKPGAEYPATMVTTADTDDRVVPMHSFKFAAAMQAAQAGDDPILLRVEIRSGHGAGTPVSKQIEVTADRWAFLVEELGFEPDIAD